MTELSRLIMGFCLASVCCSASWANPRTVFIQMFEWPWKDIARECEVYLGPAGFSAVQVSPPHEHIVWRGSPWWERYQVASYNLNSRSGSEAEFVDMIRRCQNVGVDIYADVILNHTVGIRDGVGFAGTPFYQYHLPGIYSYDDFHHCGRNGNDRIENFSDRYELQNCELVDLDDLNTGSGYVQDRLALYLNHLLDLGVAGFRVDAAKHIAADHLAEIYKRLNRSVYIYHEVIYDSTGPIQYSEYTRYGDVLAYDYPHILGDIFRHNKASNLTSFTHEFPGSDQSIVSLTNHDLERHSQGHVLSFNDSNNQLYRLAQIFMLAWPYGYPQLYSGYRFRDFDQGPPLTHGSFSMPVLGPDNACQDPWTCEHRLPEVALMVQFRNLTNASFSINNWWTNGQNQIAFGRGSVGYVAMNFSTETLTRQFESSLPEGSYCNILAPQFEPNNGDCGHEILISNRGTFSATMSPYSALVLLNTPSARTKYKYEK